MRWEGRRQSGNILDQRGMRTAGALGGGGLLIALVLMFLTGDPSLLFDLGASGERTEEGPPPDSPEAKSQREFVGVVLADTEDVWQRQFAARGDTYVEPKLVLFTGQVSSACGMASSAVGPFYCSQDQQVYLDFSFFDELDKRLGAGGDFARAYVIAHEIGHHVQNLVGTMEQVQSARQHVGEVASNRLSVALELQADCYAGIWANNTEAEKQVLEAGDIEEALGAAAAVGDDSLQKMTQGQVVPDSFTHGTSAQRAAWFKRGYESGNMKDCNTFGD